MFSIDLDELDDIANNIFFVSRNRFNVFNFRDSDHLVVSRDACSTKQQLFSYLFDNGIDTRLIGRVQLITHLATFGYQFNPVSFYFCFTPDNRPVCSVVEISNTFGEMKLFLLDEQLLQGRCFKHRATKLFYVSPFIDMDSEFDFHLNIPGEDLLIRINDFKDGNQFFISTLKGKKQQLTNLNVVKYALRFPLITLQVISLIHWQAFKLWLKKINYQTKASFRSLQQQVLKPHKSLLK